MDEAFLPTGVRLRPAVPDDARALARLIEMAAEGIPTFLWAQMAEPGETPLDVGERRARRETGGFSYRHALVAEAGGAVTGMILAYPLPAPAADPLAELEGVPDFLRPFVELELTVPESFYINAFAVEPGWRSRGVGAALLAAALERGRAAGCRRASVQHFSENPRSGAFYRRHGFRFQDERPLVAHPAFRYTEQTVLLVRDL